jgi:hypothetical protein
MTIVRIALANLYASSGSPTMSAVVRPDGTRLTYQPHGKPGLLVADLDLDVATGLLGQALQAVLIHVRGARGGERAAA